MCERQGKVFLKEKNVIRDVELARREIPDSGYTRIDHAAADNFRRRFADSDDAELYRILAAVIIKIFHVVYGNGGLCLQCIFTAVKSRSYFDTVFLKFFIFEKSTPKLSESACNMACETS